MPRRAIADRRRQLDSLTVTKDSTCVATHVPCDVCPGTFVSLMSCPSRGIRSCPTCNSTPPLCDHRLR
jgi:hypothetical protein